MTGAVSVKNLTRRFGDFTAVSDVSFDVKKGEILGFLGANGAGKSTTIKILCGILKPTSGSAFVSGYNVEKEPGFVKRSIGYMSQKFSLYSELTVLENMKFFARLYDVSSADLKSRIDETAASVSLNDYLDVKASDLSSGIRQRLSLACSVIHRPGILFLDEPTSGVDPLSRRSFWDIIYSFSSSGAAVFVTTHYMDEAEYCDRVAMMVRGKLEEIGTPAELKNDRMRLNVYSVRVVDANRAEKELAAMPGVKDAGIFGGDIRLLTDKNVTAEDIDLFLSFKGFSGHETRRSAATLEDVFVSLSERKN